MSTLQKGLLLAVLQVALVCSLGAKLLYDRATRPRLWLQVVTFDPDLPIRGRYLVFNLQLPAEGFQSVANQPSPTSPFVMSRCDLQMRNGQLTAVANPDGEYWVSLRFIENQIFAIVNTRTPYFVPEHAKLPPLQTGGEGLWIEATIPRKGPPRPIRLATKKDGVLTPLTLN